MRFPHSYTNTAVARALDALHQEPNDERLGEVLDAATRGGLVVDITGTNEESGAQARTLVSSDGHTVLPLFTSMRVLEEAVGAASPGTLVQAAILPAKDALALALAENIAAVQLDPGPNALVVARPHIEALLGGHSETSG